MARGSVRRLKLLCMLALMPTTCNRLVHSRFGSSRHKGHRRLYRHLLVAMTGPVQTKPEANNLSLPA